MHVRDVYNEERVDAHCPHLIKSSSNPNLDVKVLLAMYQCHRHAIATQKIEIKINAKQKFFLF
jgi:hypothetical protein